MTEGGFEIEPMQKYQYDVAMAFGQGPTLDITTKIKAETAASSATEVNTWARTTAVAMGYLNLKKQYREAVWSGGKTGGAAFPSEAELMARTEQEVFGQLAIANERLEDASGNTLANFENSLNVMDREERNFDRMMFVASHFHAPRIRLLAILFNIHNFDVLSSEQVIKVMVEDKDIDNGIIEKAADALMGKRDKNVPARQALHNWIDRRLDDIGLNRGEGDYHSFVGGGDSIEDKKKGYTPYEKALEQYPESPEGVTYTKRGQNEDMFSEGLARMPANWLGFIADIDSDDRLKGIIDNLLEINPAFFEQLNIDPRQSLDTLREQLRPYKDKPARVFVSLEHKTYDFEPTQEAIHTILRVGRSKRRANK